MDFFFSLLLYHVARIIVAVGKSGIVHLRNVFRFESSSWTVYWSIRFMSASFDKRLMEKFNKWFGFSGCLLLPCSEIHFQIDSTPKRNWTGFELKWSILPLLLGADAIALDSRLMFNCTFNIAFQLDRLFTINAFTLSIKPP